MIWGVHFTKYVIDIACAFIDGMSRKHTAGVLASAGFWLCGPSLDTYIDSEGRAVHFSISQLRRLDRPVKSKDGCVFAYAGVNKRRPPLPVSTLL